MALFLFFYILLHFVNITAGQTDTIYYYLEDNTVESTFIGNIVSDGQLQLVYTTSILHKLSYIFLNNVDYVNYFSIEENTGNIKTSQFVDRDILCPKKNECQLELDVAVQPNTYFRVIKVLLAMTDENDNAPRFKDLHVELNLPESTPLGVISPLSTATDLDSPANGVKGYRLVDSFNRFQLKVKNNTDYSGLEVNLMLISMLDREDFDIYHLKIIAFDRGVPSRSGSLNITIKVHDVNDNHPQFEQKTYHIDVNETFPLGESIIQVHAQDIDSGDNGEVRYSFSASNHNDINDTFILEHETGQLKLKRPLDFESDPFYSISIIAEDQGINSIPSNAKILISVLDVNDVSPKIIINDLPKSGILHIIENLPKHAYLAHISIYDDEVGNNGKVHCFIDSNKFLVFKKLYEKEYKIITIQSLDREETATINVKIVCEDFGTPALRSEMDLLVAVDDENDNSPVFVSNTNRIEIEEGNIPGSKVTKVVAKDDDLGLNGEVRYFCEHTFFSIDIISGDVSTNKQFDREKEDMFIVTVIARDLGSNPRYNTTVFNVIILDIDDNEPIFQSKYYHMNISENSPFFTFIGKVFAEDKDAEIYNQFQYFPIHLEKTVGLFIVNNETGAIYSNDSFDRESETEYIFQIGVCPKMKNICQDFTTVVVEILDENDNAPIITFPSQHSNHIVLSNKTPIGYKVTKVLSYDLDSGNNSHLIFQLIQHEEQYFFIDNDIGNIFVNKALWPMNGANFTLQILVSDFGFPRKTSQSSLYITVNNTLIPDPLSFYNMYNTNFVDMVAIVVGTLCGVLVAILLVLLFVLLILRHRRKNNDTMKEQIHNKATNTIVNRHFSTHVRNDKNKVIMASKNTHNQKCEYNFEEEKQRNFVITPMDKDCDSRCFDHSCYYNSEKKQPKPPKGKYVADTDSGKISSIPVNTNLTVVQTKCYHPLKYKQSTLSAPSVNVDRSSVRFGDCYLCPPCEKKEVKQQTNLHQSENLVKQYNLKHEKRHKVPRFTNYLNSESQQLKEKGHVYHVTSPTFSVKKTVRFKEPESCETNINKSFKVSQDNMICPINGIVNSSNFNDKGNFETIPCSGFIVSESIDQKKVGADKMKCSAETFKHVVTSNCNLNSLV